MRWSDYLGAMPPAQREQLVNLVTAGCGNLALAARLLTASGQLVQALHLLTAADAALLTVRSLLAGGLPASAVGAVDDVHLTATLPPMVGSWQNYIARYGPASSRCVLASLADAASCARRVG